MALGTVISTFALVAPRGICWDGEALWIVAGGAGFIQQIDPVTGTAKRSIAFPGGVLPSGITWDGRTLWVLTAHTNVLYQVDPNTGTVIKTFAGLPPAGTFAGITWDGRSLWISGAFAGPNVLYQVDPNTGSIIRAIGLPVANCMGVEFDGRSFWIIAWFGVLFQMSLSGALIQSTAALAGITDYICWDGRTLWATNSNGGVVYQVSVN